VKGRAAATIIITTPAHLQLQVQLVARRARWEQALASWRRLRTHHSIRRLCAAIAGPEFAEPAERTELFLELSAAQQAAYGNVLVQCQGVRALGPPALGAAAAAAWVQEGEQLLQRWEAQVADFMARWVVQAAQRLPPARIGLLAV
jgi:hypothetical protein